MNILKSIGVVLLGLGVSIQAHCEVNADQKATSVWAPSTHTMLTQWGANITPDNVWQSYPRPQLQREQWLNLNGLWRYAIVDRKAAEPQQWQGDILVPFAIESPLSGVGKRLKQEALWYQTEFELAKEPKQKQILHFEAVDYACKIWLNDVFVGANMGGNLPFKFDVSHAAKSGANKLTVRVIDDTDAADRYQLRGKQTQNNQGIWYTPVSGIWQTVWLENVAETYIDSLRMTANAQGELQVKAKVLGNQASRVTLKTDISFNGQLIASHHNLATQHTLTLADATLWSPENPALYDLSISVVNANGEVLDKVNSYIGFRTLAKRQDAEGHWKFTLNGKDVFHWGPLDQGWWPDGLLTPPSDAAIEYEMDFLKSAGFNMIRKHKKVEPRRYYYHADKKGFLIWQDQVSGGADTNGGKQEWPKWQQASQAIDTNIAAELEAHWPQWAHQQYMSELRHMIDNLYNHPSIAVWTTFNERWGQHQTMRVGEFVQQYDSSRYLNIASGGNFFAIGDIADAHHYPEPKFLLNEPMFNDYIKVVGEFGGHGWPVENHLWAPEREKMIYGNMPESIDEFRHRYRHSIENLSKLKSQGIAAGVYTQTTDVETEINGLLTYDRKVKKIAVEELKALHQQNELSNTK